MAWIVLLFTPIFAFAEYQRTAPGNGDLSPKPDKFVRPRVNETLRTPNTGSDLHNSIVTGLDWTEALAKEVKAGNAEAFKKRVNGLTALQFAGTQNIKIFEGYWDQDPRSSADKESDVLALTDYYASAVANQLRAKAKKAGTNLGTKSEDEQIKRDFGRLTQVLRALPLPFAVKVREASVRNLYRNLLYRNATEVEVAHWANVMGRNKDRSLQMDFAAVTAAGYGVIDSTEAKRKAPKAEEIRRAFLNRVGSEPSLEEVMDYMKDSETPEGLSAVLEKIRRAVPPR